MLHTPLIYIFFVVIIITVSLVITIISLIWTTSWVNIFLNVWVVDETTKLHQKNEMIIAIIISILTFEKKYQLHVE